MHILMTLSNPFTHDPRVYNEAQSLIKAGHKITMIAWDRKKQNTPSETKDQIKIHRIRNTKLMDILPYDILKIYWWQQEAYKKALKIHKKNPFDIIHAHNLDTLLTGVKLKKKLKIPLIYDAHEIWGYMVEKDLPKIWSNHYLKKEKKLIKNADQIITVNQPLKDYFSKQTNKTITIIMNCKHLQKKEYTPPKNKEFTLLYIGGLSKSRYLHELVDIVKEIPNTKLIIGGIGKTEYVKTLKEKIKQTKNIEYIGPVPPEQVLTMTKKADTIICIFDPKNKNNQVGLPNKVFESATVGRPLIITKGLYYEKIVVEQGNFGIAVKYNKQDIKNGITKLRDQPNLREQLGKNGLKLAKKEYNWEHQEKKLTKIYEEQKK